MNTQSAGLIVECSTVHSHSCCQPIFPWKCRGKSFLVTGGTPGAVMSMRLLNQCSCEHPCSSTLFCFRHAYCPLCLAYAPPYAGCAVPMKSNRWYPTGVTLPQGRGLIVGGSYDGTDINNGGKNNPSLEYWPPRSSSDGQIGLGFLSRTVRPDPVRRPHQYGGGEQERISPFHSTP